MPKVTVLMPVYNAEKYIKEAVDSILGQSFADFEFLIINDGSTDGSVKIIKKFLDTRIRLIANEKNLGVITTLNKGFDLAQGEYIARMDADDISLPQRLELQVDFMDKHPEIGACGSWVKKFGKLNFKAKYFTKPEEIKAAFLFNVSLAHPSVMIRKKILDDNKLRFDHDYLHAEDYDFWVRMMNFTKLANLPFILLNYRLHLNSISQIHKEIQHKNATRVKLKELLDLGLNPGQQELNLHSSFKPATNQAPLIYLNDMEVWLNKIITANYKSGRYETVALKKIISNRWLEINYANADYGTAVFKKYWRSNLRQGITLTDKKMLFKFLFKACRFTFKSILG